MLVQLTRVLSAIFLLGFVVSTSAQYDDAFDSFYGRSDPVLEDTFALRNEFDRSLLARSIVDRILDARHTVTTRELDEGPEDLDIGRRAVEQVVHVLYKDPNEPFNAGDHKLYGKTFTDVRSHIARHYTAGGVGLNSIHILRGTSDNEITNYSQKLQDAGLQHGDTIYYRLDDGSDSEGSSAGGSGGSGGSGAAGPSVVTTAGRGRRGGKPTGKKIPGGKAPGKGPAEPVKQRGGLKGKAGKAKAKATGLKKGPGKK